MKLFGKNYYYIGLLPIFFKTPLTWAQSKDKSLVLEKYGYFFRWKIFGISLLYKMTTGKIYRLVEKKKDPNDIRKSKQENIITYSYEEFWPYEYELADQFMMGLQK